MGEAIAVIVMSVILLYVVLRLAWMFWRNEELDAGGSYGRQFASRKKGRELLRRLVRRPDRRGYDREQAGSDQTGYGAS